MARSEPKLTEEEVFAVLYFRDRRDYPVMTIAELAEVIATDDSLADVSRKTVERKVKSLVEKGAIQERKHGRLGVYWVEREGEGVCPACHRPILSKARARDEHEEDTEPLDRFRFGCRWCESEFTAIIHPGGDDTILGELTGRALSFFDWWNRLGSRTREWFKKLTKLRFRIDYPDDEYPEESLTVAEDGFDALTEDEIESPGDGVYPPDDEYLEE